MDAREAGRPRVVGRYALFDAIASGGMAQVHFGRLLGPVGFSRTVAIKRLHESFASDPDFVAMFLDEARLAARIRHPNVVPTLDIVTVEQELLLVMEYVSGESLSLLLRRARGEGEDAPIPIVVDILVNALSGLHAAHEATSEQGTPLRIVHRDVSPQNILVGTDGVSRVLDFGVAKAVGRAHQTREGQVKGKLRYMAPEQILGKDVTRKADIYAASVILWEALTGERMFKADSDAAVMYEVLKGGATPPSQLRPEVPRALDAIVRRGLQLDPRDRFETAEAMAKALENAVQPVARSTVAAWVAANAREAIERRRERLAFVESTGSFPVQRPDAWTPPVKSEVTLTADAVSSVTPPSVERSVPAPSRAHADRSSRAKWIAVGAAAAVVAAALMTVVWHRPTDVASAAAVVTLPATELPPKVIAAVPPTEAPPPAPSASNEVAAAPIELPATAAASVVAAVSAPPAPRKRPAWGPAAKPAPPKTPPPNPLYRRD